MKTIFVVTVFGEADEAEFRASSKHRRASFRRQRTWGWFSTWAAAHEAIVLNHTDMFEALYYDTAVIEEFDEGMLAEAVERGWFRAEAGSGERNEPWLHPIVTEIDRPEWAHGICHWGMG